MKVLGIGAVVVRKGCKLLIIGYQLPNPGKNETLDILQLNIHVARPEERALGYYSRKKSKNFAAKVIRQMKGGIMLVFWRFSMKVQRKSRRKAGTK